VSKEWRTPGFVVAATGLRAEARIAARSIRVRAIAGGGAGEEFERRLRQAIAEGGEAIISFGLAAGLAPGMIAGTCLIGREVVHSGTCHSTDPMWASRLKAALGRADVARIAGVDQPLSGVSEKQALHAKSGAAAADMESHIVGRLAAEYGLPFAVLRVIADPAERPLPAAALAGMSRDGRINVRSVLASLAGSPSQLPALMRLAADMGRAMAALFRCHNLLGPGLGFGDRS
jgi:adenosylhomocysteine nucleosidase